ncbi:MAG: hypothetical protein M1837_001815, partial [Sclerophora amabilis]
HQRTDYLYCVHTIKERRNNSAVLKLSECLKSFTFQELRHSSRAKIRKEGGILGHFFASLATVLATRTQSDRVMATQEEDSQVTRTDGGQPTAREENLSTQTEGQLSTGRQGSQSIQTERETPTGRERSQSDQSEGGLPPLLEGSQSNQTGEIPTGRESIQPSRSERDSATLRKRRQSSRTQEEVATGRKRRQPSNPGYVTGKDMGFSSPQGSSPPPRSPEYQPSNAEDVDRESHEAGRKPEVASSTMALEFLSSVVELSRENDPLSQLEFSCFPTSLNVEVPGLSLPCINDGSLIKQELFEGTWSPASHIVFCSLEEKAGFTGWIDDGDDEIGQMTPSTFAQIVCEMLGMVSQRLSRHIRPLKLPEALNDTFLISVHHNVLHFFHAVPEDDYISYVFSEKNPAWLRKLSSPSTFPRDTTFHVRRIESGLRRK